MTGTPLSLGAVSMSLAVTDLRASEAFYTKLGFVARGSDASQGWLILNNDVTTIGLFQGRFEKNSLTFNPGWSAACETLPSFTDVRDIQARLEADGIEIVKRAVDGGGPAHFVVNDPDGNPVLIDQHVART
jgi:lactoylglutathione lyase